MSMLIETPGMKRISASVQSVRISEQSQCHMWDVWLYDSPEERRIEEEIN